MLKLPEKQCAPQELNNLNRPRSGAVTSKAGNMQRVGGPVAHMHAEYQARHHGCYGRAPLNVIVYMVSALHDTVSMYILG